jgi:hypothetical protein
MLKAFRVELEGISESAADFVVLNVEVRARNWKLIRAEVGTLDSVGESLKTGREGMTGQES